MTTSVTLSRNEINDLLENAAEKGARRALVNVGLNGDERIAQDIRELRSLLKAFNMAKSTAWKMFIRMLSFGLFLMVVSALGLKSYFTNGS